MNYSPGQTVVCVDDANTHGYLTTGKEYVVKAIDAPAKLVLVFDNSGVLSEFYGWRFDPKDSNEIR
jgi:hypothetical protein